MKTDRDLISETTEIKCQILFPRVVNGVRHRVGEEVWLPANFAVLLVVAGEGVLPDGTKLPIEMARLIRAAGKVVSTSYRMIDGKFSVH